MVPLEPQPEPAPRPSPETAASQVKPAPPRPAAAGAGAFKLAAVAAFAVSLAAVMAFKEVREGMFSLVRGSPPAVSGEAAFGVVPPGGLAPPAPVEFRVAVEQPGDNMPFEAVTVEAPGAPGPQQADGLVAYQPAPAREAVPGPAQPPAQAPVQMPARTPAPAPRLKPVDFFSKITKAAGASHGGLRTTSVDNPNVIQGRPATQEEAAGAVPPGQAPPAAVKPAQKPWRIPPCDWKVVATGGLCVNANNEVTTQETNKKCKAFGATDCVGQPLGPIPVAGKVLLVEKSGGKYVYNFVNTSDKPLKARIASQSGESWDVDLAPGASKRIDSRTRLGGDNRLFGARR